MRSCESAPHFVLFTYRNNAMENDMQEPLPRSMLEITSFTVDERWKAFAAVHEWPTTFPEIRAASGLPVIVLIFLLDELEKDGLIVMHSEEFCEWRLA